MQYGTHDPHCGGEVRIIGFITEAPCVRAILVSIGEPTTPPEVAPARGPPAGEEAFERVLEGALAPAPVPQFVFDQRLGW